MAKLDEKGNLITSSESLKTLYLNTYKKRLAHKIRHPKHKDIYEMKEEIWSIRYDSLNNIKSENLTTSDVKTALSSLKNNKTHDPLGMINETLKDCSEESDLVKALTELINGIKKSKHIPDFMTFSNITSVYKQRVSHGY